MLIDDIFKDISATIGCTSADLIRDVVDNSNKKKILYHGIKNSSNVEKIEKEGLLPLTPESGPCSFWSTGIALFDPPIDSSFFRYSGGASANPEISELNLAITNYYLLSKAGLSLPDYHKDSQLKIKEVVPYETLTLIGIEVKHPQSKDYRTSRKYRQAAEQMLLKAIIAQAYGVFSLGKTINYSKEIK